MRKLVSQLLALGPELVAFILTSPLLLSPSIPTLLPGAHAQAVQSVPAPDLDLSRLGRVALAGDFDSVSLYQYVGQDGRASGRNGGQALLSRNPDGSFRVARTSDAYILSMCPYTDNGGRFRGIAVGGNFTRLGDQQAQGIALYDPGSGQVTPLSGLTGSVGAVYCGEGGTMYVGGSFSAANSTNAIIWQGDNWDNLPFGGFNGPVTSISKDSAGNVVFGGSFTGLGNASITPDNPDQQVVAIGSGYISSSGTAPTDGFNDPSNIICKTASNDGAGNTWLLADNTGGWWEGQYGFGFNPTMIRLYNTQQAGRGTKTWYFQNMNSGGIMQMSYYDENGVNQTCYNFCPLAQNSSAQDFHFVNTVGMNSFRIYITDWYGSGAGLDGIELFQDDIYSFAVDSFNEPQCDDVSNRSSAIASPSNLWIQTPNNGRSTSDYLTASIADASQLNAGVSVIFSPNIEQSGNYSITVYTPGCLQDNTCLTRGEVNLTGSMTSTMAPITTTLFQSNNYDKYDQIYYGFVDVSSGSFKPTVTLSPTVGQSVPLTVVAQRVRFELISSDGGLNGLYEYNSRQAASPTSDLSTSAIDRAGTNLDIGAMVNEIVASGGTTFVAGNFSADGISNVMSITDNATSLANGGLNGAVSTMYLNGSTLYFGGDFTNTAENSVDNLNSLAVYDVDGNRWSALGAGVTGSVDAIVPVSLNVSAGDAEACLSVSGAFTAVNGFGGNPAFNASGFAVWVLSRRNWLNNLANSTLAIDGQLTAMTAFNGSQTLYAGQIFSQGMAASGAVELEDSGDSLESFGVRIQSAPSSASSSMRKRATTGTQNYTGVYTGLYYGEEGLNITVLGGQFSAVTSNGSTAENLIIVNNTASEQSVIGVNDLDSDSTFMALAYSGRTLYAGGAVTGRIGDASINGLVVYDLVAAEYASPQPPALQGDSVVVYAIALQPDNPNLYVGGNFASAGSLPCDSLCYYDTSALQWNSPGSGLSGTITTMVWTSSTSLVIAGNITVGGNRTTMATYDTRQTSFEQYQGAASLPGTITALTTADSRYQTWWAAGSSTSDGTAFLSKYGGDGDWTTVTGFGAGTSIRGLQMIPLTSRHANTDLVESDMVLMITGNINVPSFGNASAVLYNGTTFQPYVLTNTAGGGQGSLSQLFVSNPAQFLRSHGSRLAVGLVVLIGLAIALGLVFLVVVAGILIERQRRRKEGYVPIMGGNNGNLERIPPSDLLGNIHNDDVPRIR